VRTGEVSARELAEAALRQIEAHAALNAFSPPSTPSPTSTRRRPWPRRTRSSWATHAHSRGCPPPSKT
jgi:hypothetical protein